MPVGMVGGGGRQVALQLVVTAWRQTKSRANATVPPAVVVEVKLPVIVTVPLPLPIVRKPPLIPKKLVLILPLKENKSLVIGSERLVELAEVVDRQPVTETLN